MKYRQEDMPFTKDGMIPDLILNPHAIPSRMTIGHLIETIASKVAAIDGQLSDHVTFGPKDDDKPFKTVDELSIELEKNGYQFDGSEIMYNPHTGRKLESRIFFGPVFYQRLKHMVIDKCHARSTGRNEILTRQPVEGRARDGGFRFGEMERDAVLSHGATAFLQDRGFYNSDYYQVPVCKICGLIAVRTKGNDKVYCTRCNKSSDNSKNEIKMSQLP